MSYVDAIYDREKDLIKVVGRDTDGNRTYTEHPANYLFYYPDPRGKYKSIYGDVCSMYSSGSHKAFMREKMLVQRSKKLFESDINPVFRCLEQTYRGIEAPALNLCFFDIEVAFDTKRGFAPTEDPFNEVTAISCYLSHINKLITLVLCPPTMDLNQAEAITNKFEDTFLFDDETALLKAFLDIIEDSDVLSGWNSTGFDIPYLVNRIIRVIGKDEARRFCLWNQAPKKREYIKFKKKSTTYDLVGRVHLDYLELYQKHNSQQLHSYRLDFVGEIEVKENKVPYEGTLDDLYKKDFQKFIEYNRQDTMLLVKIDAKKKFIELANQIAHTNTVLLKTTMGSVALIEQSIINEAHDRGMVVPDRKMDVVEDEDEEEYDDEDDEEGGGNVKKNAVGAYVAKPKTGLQEEIGCCDINSLYPSTLRALNMSPETLVGHIRPTETEAMIQQRIADGVAKSDLWEGVFCTLEYDHVMARDKAQIVVDFEDGTTRTFRADELNDYIFHEDRPLCITANGTIFRTDVAGVIPSLLARWYSQRKEMQARENTYAHVTDDHETLTKLFDGNGVSEFVSQLETELPKAQKSEVDVGKFLKALYAKDAKLTAEIMVSYGFRLEGDNIYAEDKATAKSLKTFWNQRQQARKILLNSLYGALLNESMKFYDKRIGQSVTLTGRSIARHMNSKINEIITGQYDYKGEAIIYADTDSSYFSAKKVWANDPQFKDFEFTRENIIKLYDGIGEEVNGSFPEFMTKSFNTGLERGGIIKAGRELVASKGLFIKKKKYAVLMYDKDGQRYDVDGEPGKLKVMGLDLKRSDTPQFMQDFLEDVLMSLLTGSTQDEIFDMIRKFRRDFRGRPGWEKGTPKRVNGLSDYTDREEQAADVSGDFRKLKVGTKSKINMPGQARAGLNWNKLCKMHNDMFSMRITDGAKTIVCKLKPNPLGMNAVAYPIDEPHLPTWFKELPFDHTTMEDTIIDAKLKNLLGVLNWDLSQANDDLSNDLFSW
jgi:DNA polymerase elongation subunit (family B)